MDQFAGIGALGRQARDCTYVQSMASGLKQSRIKSGETLRADLCTASGSQAPRNWDETTLNRLLDLVDVPKDERDPLGFKQALTALSPALGSLTLRARKEMMTALTAHATAAKGYGLSGRFGDWPPAGPEPPPPPARPLQPAEKRVDPLAGAADGYRWTQSETDLAIAVPVPPGTSKTEVMLQLTPRHGPATRLVLRARFWPQPLVVGELHAAVEAGECMWHLSADAMEVVIDMPKVEPELWPSIIKPLAALGHSTASAPPPPPVAGGILPSAVAAVAAAASGEARAGTASVAGSVDGVAVAAASVRLDVVVQRMGQRPRQLGVVSACMAILQAAIDPDTHARAAAVAGAAGSAAKPDPGGIGTAAVPTPREAADAAALTALNARVVPLLLRAVREAAPRAPRKPARHRDARLPRDVGADLNPPPPCVWPGFRSRCTGNTPRCNWQRGVSSPRSCAAEISSRSWPPTPGPSTSSWPAWLRTPPTAPSPAPCCAPSGFCCPHARQSRL